MASPIIWQNATSTVTVMDIPRSIAAAQGTLQQPCHDHLLSVEPLRSPFPSNEPKSHAAMSRVANDAGDGELHSEYTRLINQALSEVRASHPGEWCQPRRFVNSISASTQETKRKRDAQLPVNSLPTIARLATRIRGSRYCFQLSGDSLRSDRPSLSESSTQDTHFMTNPSDDPMLLRISGRSSDDTETSHFRIPAHSSFNLSDCANADAFRSAVRDQAQQHDTRRTFDLVLLDPPWPSRSIKRTHKSAGATYNITANLEEMSQMLLGMDLEMLMAKECLVGVWITNKSAVRQLMLDPGEGVFASWGVELVEEWVWVKTTVAGEPVTPLEGVWRKPYEVLLLGRKRSLNEAVGPPAVVAEGEVETGIKRRVVISVPDLHSRKPCLKDLLEPLMPDPKDYRALEVFARHLVVGWWSCGDECVKFNWEGNWQRPETG